MVHQEIQRYAHHYTLLILGEATLLSAFLVIGVGSIRILVAILVGILYATWGIYIHRKELHTLRLVLEYVSMGLLATVMLIALVHNL